MKRIGETLDNMKNPLESIFPKNRNRKMPLIDALPLYSAISFAVFFVIIGVALTLVGSIWKLSDLVIEDMNAPFNGTQIGPFFGPQREKIRVDFGQYSRYNEFMAFLVKFRKWNDDYGLWKDGVSFKFSLFVRNSVREDYKEIIKDKVVYTRLDCPNGVAMCKPMMLDYLETCEYMDYRLEVQLYHDLDCKPALADYVDIAYRSSTSPWLIIQIVFSIIFFLGVVAFTVFFFCFTMAFQKFREWMVEQWMVLLLLVLLIFYINPFYLVDDVTDSSFFTYIMKFFDSLFIADYVVFLWFVLNVFIQFIEEGPEKKKKSFWIIQGVVAVVYWVFFFPVVLDFRYSRGLQAFFQIVVYCLVAVQIIMFPFQLFKYILVMRKKILTYETLKRVILLFSIVFMSIVMTTLIVLIKNFDDEANKVCYFLLFLTTTFVLAVNYLPSTKEHFDLQDDEADPEQQRIITDGVGVDVGETEQIVGEYSTQQIGGTFKEDDIGAEDDEAIDAHVDI